jgi:hypothetical protein
MVFILDTHKTKLSIKKAFTNGSRLSVGWHLDAAETKLLQLCYECTLFGCVGWIRLQYVQLRRY